MRAVLASVKSLDRISCVVRCVTTKSTSSEYNGGLLHLNNAGCSISAPQVVESVHSFLDLESRYGGYEAVEREDAKTLLQKPYTGLAKILNCEETNIGVTNSATAAWQRIFLGLPLWLPGSCIITSVIEYGSNFIAYLQVQKRFGTTIRVLRETESGAVDIDHLHELLEQRDRKGLTLVSISHIPTSSGRVYDAEAVGTAIKEYDGVIYLLDACQSVGQLVVDVERIGCHFLTGTGRKFLRGPRGTGFLYASPTALTDERLEPAAMDVRGASWLSKSSYTANETALRYEEYEMSFAGRVGLGVACEYALQVGMENIQRQSQIRAQTLRNGLGAIRGVELQDVGNNLCAIVSFTVDGMDPNALKSTLKNTDCGGKYPAGINVSVSAAPSTRLDFDQRGIAQVIRASPHYFTKDEELGDFLGAIEKICTSRQE